MYRDLHIVVHVREKKATVLVVSDSMGEQGDEHREVAVSLEDIQRWTSQYAARNLDETDAQIEERVLDRAHVLLEDVGRRR